MATKLEKERLKLIQEKCQLLLNELLRDDDNKYCVDCDAKGPRWASWNLGIFLCIRCAGIHRNLGVHISRVKSVNLDSWTPEQVAHLQQMGNSKARAVYEANLPDNFRRPQTDSTLEAFIRGKYEQKKYIAKEWVQPPAPAPAFDIEEERRKDKEKKKKGTSKCPTSAPAVDVQNNSVPRPHSSPASSVISADKVLEKGKKVSTESKTPYSDLLGLNLAPNNGGDNVSYGNSEDDPFDAFVSAPVGEVGTLVDAKSNGSDPKKDEEADFFNQKAPEEKRMDTESILKLFNNSNNFVQPQVSQGYPFGNPLIGQFNAIQSPPNGVPVIPQGALYGNIPNSLPPASGPTQMHQSFPVTTNPFLSTNTSTSTASIPGPVPVSQLQHQMGSLQVGPALGGNWITPQLQTPLGQVPVGQINPFMSASPLIMGSIPSNGSFGNNVLNNQQDNANSFSEWELPLTGSGNVSANPGLAGLHLSNTLPATNLWQ